MKAANISYSVLVPHLNSDQVMQYTTDCKKDAKRFKRYYTSKPEYKGKQVRIIPNH